VDDRIKGLLARAERRIAELESNEARLVEAQRISGVGSYDFEIATQTNLWSDQLYRIYGREPQSFNASYEVFLSMLHPEDREHVMAVHQHSLATLQPFEMEERVVWPDGQVRTLASWGEVVADEAGAPVRMVGICWDITERKAIEQQLVHDALHDALTGLPNRLLLEDRLTVAVESLARKHEPLAVLFVDIDRFKVINDSLGHRAGDQALVEIARRIGSAVRPGDTVARFGGDEFVVLCEDLRAPGEAIAIADRVLEATSRPLVVEGGAELVLSVSTGIALASDPDHQPDGLLRDADAAMYQAKNDGRARSVVFVETMRQKARARLDIETELRRALAEQQLRVHYQPIFDLVTQQLMGVEALVRWQHPTRGLVLPGDFIPIAEETGLVAPIGDWVLREACRQLVTWHAHSPDLMLSVNLSGVQVVQPDVVSKLAAALDSTGVSPAHVALEMTETVLMRDAADTLSVLRSFKDLGVQLHVDDFGTGYSSLTYLKRFPVDALKVDRSFVNGLASDLEDYAIVAAIIGLARALGLETIAEGVESAKQRKILRELGCTYAQGYLLSRPADAATLTTLLTTPVPQARRPVGDMTVRSSDDTPVRRHP
jgi:diguanylate cyclase (GGDEF)-like protein/PAS domain S-box-containing protein